MAYITYYGFAGGVIIGPGPKLVGTGFVLPFVPYRTNLTGALGGLANCACGYPDGALLMSSVRNNSTNGLRDTILRYYVNGLWRVARNGGCSGAQEVAEAVKRCPDDPHGTCVIGDQHSQNSHANDREQYGDDRIFHDFSFWPIGPLFVSNSTGRL